jgi:hypothetical protein
MTALAAFPAARTDQRADGPRNADTGPSVVPGPVLAADRSGAVRDRARTIRSWPLVLLAFPAAAEVWSGWVGIAQKTGFGQVSPLPGIWPSLHLDTSITLPIGVEAYAAYALRAWLAGEHWISPRTRQFAKWSAIFSFALGMAGQVAYHLLNQAGETRAPWGITTVVSCLPVLVLAMGTTLAHMLRGDTAAADSQPPGALGGEFPARSAKDQPADHPGRDRIKTVARTRTTGRSKTGTRTSQPTCSPDPATPPGPTGNPVHATRAQHSEEALRIGRELAAEGRRVSRRALRCGGLKGSNENLNELARVLNAELAAGKQVPSRAAKAGHQIR